MSTYVPSKCTLWRSRTVAVLLIPPACVGTYYVGQLLAANNRSPAIAVAQPNPLPTVNGLFIVPTSLALGEVWEEPEYVVKLTIENRGEKAVTVTDFGLACECTSVKPRSLALSPGQSAEVRVELDLLHRLPYQHGLEKRPLSVRIDPVFANVGRPVTGWEITGTVRSRVSLETPRLHFDDKCVQYGPPASRKVKAVAHIPIKTLAVTGVPDLASLRVEPIDGQQGHFVIVVTPNPKLPVGPFRFEVNTTTVEPDGVRHPCASFTVHGEMLPPARIVPGIVLLGEHPVGETVQAEVMVRLPEGAGWKIDHIEIDTADTAVSPKRDLDDKVLRYTITQKINEAGDQTRVVRFVIREPNGKTEPCTMKIVFHGEKDPRQGRAGARK